MRVPSCGYLSPLYINNHWLAWIAYIDTTYIEFYQFFGHTLISANRFAVFVLPLKYNWVRIKTFQIYFKEQFNLCDFTIFYDLQVWTDKALYGIVFLNIILPIPFLASRLTYDANYVQKSDGSFHLAFMKPNITFVSAPKKLVSDSITIRLQFDAKETFLNSKSCLISKCSIKITVRNQKPVS